MPTNKKDKEWYKQMTKEIAGEKNLIPGIHNYCDRWCERCAFTARCAVSRMEQEMNTNLGESDLNNKKFWEQLAMVYQATFELIEEGARRHGIDLTDIGDQIQFERQPPEETEILANSYGKTFHNWLTENQEYLSSQAKTAAIIGEKKLLSLTEAIEVLQWYCFLIGAKTHRAFFKFEFDDEIDLQDNDGSAKIAIIAIDRSLQAFSVLYHQLPEKEDDLIGFMVNLSKIKDQLINKFPKAMNFKRPGFDEL
ncbi:MAG: hypothetical protein HOO86_04455 [Bacteroidales bacterium]|nr:hypothetical protein [Bacteroidales bacterium]